MAEQGGFRPVFLGGFHKKDVYDYIERLVLTQENEREEWHRQEARLTQEVSALSLTLAQAHEEQVRLEDAVCALQEKISALEAQREGEEVAVPV